MKVIDLLNKIANGEEVPKEMCIQGDLFLKSDGTANTYELLKFLCKYDIKLNEEVEIIEDAPKEEKKIPEKLPIGVKQTKDGIFNTIVKDDIQYELNEKEEMICKKIHEIIDYLDYLKSKGE